MAKNIRFTPTSCLSRSSLIKGMKCFIKKLFDRLSSLLFEYLKNRTNHKLETKKNAFYSIYFDIRICRMATFIRSPRIS